MTGQKKKKSLIKQLTLSGNPESSAQNFVLHHYLMLQKSLYFKCNSSKIILIAALFNLIGSVICHD